MEEKKLKDVMKMKGYSIYSDMAVYITFYKIYSGCLVKMIFRKNYDNHNYNLVNFYVEGENIYDAIKLESLQFAYLNLVKDKNEIKELLNK